MEGSGSRGGTCNRVNRREGHQGDHQKDDSTYPPTLPPPQVLSNRGPSDRAPEESGSTTQEQSWSRRRATVV